MSRWLDRLYGAIAMYVACGTVVTTSLLVHTPGKCPWWLPFYWTVTWIFQVFGAIFDKGGA